MIKVENLHIWIAASAIESMIKESNLTKNEKSYMRQVLKKLKAIKKERMKTIRMKNETWRNSHKSI